MEEHIQEVEKEDKIDTKIIPLQKFINSLDGVKTIGCCQGHDDNETFDNAYLTFSCTNIRNLGLISSIHHVHVFPAYYEEDDIKMFPLLIADWEINVLSGFVDPQFPPEDIVDMGEDPAEYVVYCLSPNPLSYDKPSDIYSDFEEILDYLEYQQSKMY